MKYFAGIDIGSTNIKVALCDESGNIAGDYTSLTGSHFHKNALSAFNALLEEKGIAKEDVAYVTSTGYGRKIFKEADESVSEITANASGARKAGEGSGTVRTIINIGGQDLKVIILDAEGHVVNFAMNDKCAAGTGRFLDVTARNLEMEIDELGDCHLNAKGAPLSINSTCTVFAESEIISLLADGNGREEIVAGIHYSIARRVARLAKRYGVEDVVIFDGGPAMNKGLVMALEDEIMCDIVVPENPQVTTAYGAALLALDAWSCENESAVNA